MTNRVKRAERDVVRDRVLAVSVPVEGEGYRRWAGQWRRSGLAGRQVRRHAEWYPKAEWAWVAAATAQGFDLSPYSPHDSGCCDGKRELRHIGDRNGTVYRLVVADGVLRGLFCKFSLTDRAHERIRESARRVVEGAPELTPVGVARVARVFRGAAEETDRRWMAAR